ncbi:MAG: YgjP-like metallopeptidase domain-containing protein [Methanobacteriota archaeon]
MRKPNDAPKFIQVNGEPLPYRVEQRSVRYPRLEFKTEELLVILPKGWKDETHLLEEKKDWIFKKHSEIKSAMERLRAGMKNQSSLPIFGDFFELRPSSSLVVDLERRIIDCDLNDASQLSRLASILKKMLSRELREAAEHYGKRFGVSFKRICVKRHRSKWGSCSYRGNLNFNLWLVCLPKELVWYLACHEVAHLKEKGHGRAFWALVRGEFENYKEMEKKLFGYWFFVQEYSRVVFPSGKKLF